MNRVPPAQRRLSERAFQSQVIDLARTLGWKVCHFNDSRRSVGAGRLVGDADAAGWPDLVLCRGGRLIFAELKADGGRLSPAQVDWLWALQNVEAGAAGRVLVRVWKPTDLASNEIQRTLTGARCG